MNNYSSNNSLFKSPGKMMMIAVALLVLFILGYLTYKFMKPAAPCPVCNCPVPAPAPADPSKGKMPSKKK
jgi:hypothetical protein